MWHDQSDCFVCNYNACMNTEDLDCSMCDRNSKANDGECKTCTVDSKIRLVFELKRVYMNRETQGKITGDTSCLIHTHLLNVHNVKWIGVWGTPEKILHVHMHVLRVQVIKCHTTRCVVASHTCWTGAKRLL